MPDRFELVEQITAARLTAAPELRKLEHTLERMRALEEGNPMLGTRGVRLGLMHPEIYEMQARAIFRAARAVRERSGQAPRVEIMIPLVAYVARARAGARPRAARRRRGGFRIGRDFGVGTMIELPRACFVGGRIARHAEFFSFGTNDLTQTALGFSRDDIEARIVPQYVDMGIVERSPFATIDERGVGELVRIARRARSRRAARAGGRHLRRAWRRSRLDPVLSLGRAGLRQLLAVPCPDCACRGGAGGIGRLRLRSCASVCSLEAGIVPDSTL